MTSTKAADNSLPNFGLGIAGPDCFDGAGRIPAAGESR